MRSRARVVAHGVVLVVMAGLCATTVASGAFDVVTIPGGPTTAGDAGTPPVAAPGAPAAGEGPDDAGIPAEGDAADDPDAGAPPETADGTEPDATCQAAGRAWGDAAEAQLDVTVEHPEDLVDGFTTARDVLAQAEPPDAIARDWGVVATYVAMIADAVEAAGPGDQDELARALDRVGRRIDTTALTGSSERVTAFLQQGCPA